MALNSRQIVHLWKIGNGVPKCISSPSLKLSDRHEVVLDRVIADLESIDPGSGAQLLLSGRIAGSTHSLARAYTQHCAAIRLDHGQIEERFTLLSRLFKAGRQSGLFEDQPLPDISRAKRPRHRIDATAIDYTRIAIIWHQKFSEDIANKNRTPSRIQLFGRYLFSLCLRCGVVSTNLITALAKASAAPILATKELYYLEVLHLSAHRGRQSVRRVFLEPLTAILAIRSGTPPSPDVDNNFVWRAIREYLKALDAPDIPNSFAKFVSVCRGYLSLNLPVFMLPYADSTLPATSVPESIFRRTHGISPRSELLRHLPPVNLRANQSRDVADFQHVKKPIPTEVSKTFRALPPGNDEEALTTHLQVLVQRANDSIDRSTSVAIVARWGLSMLQTSEEGKVGMNARRVRHALCSLGPALVVALGDRAPEDVEDFSEIYEVLSEFISPKSDRSKRFHHLNSVMEYLWLTYCPTSDRIGWRETILPEAAILTPNEVQRVLAAIAESGGLIGEERERKLSQSLIAGWSLGMRTSEWLKIYLRHTSRDRIRVVGTPDRRLKSAAASRIVCTELALPDAARAIHEFLDLRADEERQGSSSIFMHAFHCENQAYTEQRVQGRITQILREITGDQQTRNYHLRHSQASWLFLAVAAQTNQLDDQLRPLLGDLAPVLDHADRWMRILREPANAVTTPMYAIACALGHSNFAVTREHYVHTFDVVLLALLMKSIFPANRSLLIAASGIPRRSTYRLPTTSIWDVVTEVEKRNSGRVAREDTPLDRELPMTSNAKLFTTLTSIHKQLRQDPALDTASLWPGDMPAIRTQTNELAQQRSDKRGSVAKRHPMSISGFGCPHPIDLVDGAVRQDASTACIYFETAFNLNREDLIWAVEQYASSAQSKHCRVSFKSREHALRFARVLYSMGFSRDSVEWGYRLQAEKRDIASESVPKSGSVWVTYVPRLANRKHRPVAGWSWVWQMLACTLGAPHLWSDGDAPTGCNKAIPDSQELTSTMP